MDLMTQNLTQVALMMVKFVLSDDFPNELDESHYVAANMTIRMQII